MKTQAKAAKEPAAGGKKKVGPAQSHAMTTGAQKLGNARMENPASRAADAATPGRRTVCLTFDDGPLPKKTSNVMAVLSEMKVPATFFLTGGNMLPVNEEKAAIFKQMLSSDLFQVGNHTYSHDPEHKVDYVKRYGQMKGNRNKGSVKYKELKFRNNDAKGEFDANLEKNATHFRNVAKLADIEFKTFDFVRLPGDGKNFPTLVSQSEQLGAKHVGWDYEIGANNLLGCVKTAEKGKAKEKWISKKANVTCNWQGIQGFAAEGPSLPKDRDIILLHDRHFSDIGKLREILKVLGNDYLFGKIGPDGACNLPDSSRRGGGQQIPTEPALDAGSAVMPRLELGRIDDPAEREAESVADRVMRMRDGGACCSACATGGPCASHAPEIGHGQAMPIRRKVAGVGNSAGLPVPTGLAPQVRRATTGGEALPATIRAFFEPRFGQDLSSVRIHRDADAAESARELGAKAYTLGSHIAFSAGRWAPGTDAGDRLIAHELAHATANGDGPIRRVVDPDDGTCLRGVMTPMAAGAAAHRKIQAAAQANGFRTSPMEASNGKAAAPRADLFGFWNEDEARQKGLPAIRTPDNDKSWVVVEIGEIKPISHAKGAMKHAKATAQIDGYLGQWKHFSNVPAVPMKSMSSFGPLELEGSDLACDLNSPDGLYIYRCSKPRDPKEAPVPIGLPVPVPKQVERELREFHDIDKLPAMTPVRARERLASGMPTLSIWLKTLIAAIGVIAATEIIVGLIALMSPLLAAAAIAAVLITAISVSDPSLRGLPSS